MTSLADGGYEVSPGKLVEVITYFEMTERPSLPAGAAAGLRRVERPAAEWYRAVFRQIGEPWLWFSRLLLDDAALERTLAAAGAEVFVMEDAGRAIGLVELDRSAPAEVEIVFFGLVPDAMGRGLGRLMMEAALSHAWRTDTRRVWLHTCQFDHPAAVRFYGRAGFRPYGTRIEIGDDPRLSGVLPADAAPHVALVRPR